MEPEQLAETVRRAIVGAGLYRSGVDAALSELVRLAGEADTLRQNLAASESWVRDLEVERDTLRCERDEAKKNEGNAILLYGEARKERDRLREAVTDYLDELAHTGMADTGPLDAALDAQSEAISPR